MKLLVIGDTQVKPDVDTSYLDWISKLIINELPDVIVQIGDWADMPSLSSYDKGKKCFQGRTYRADIESANNAMIRLLKPIKEFQQKLIEGHRSRYKPRFIMTLGNHDADRMKRTVEAQSELEGIVTIDDLYYDDWEVIPYLIPIEINGVIFSHYFYNPYTGRPLTGTMENRLKFIGKSFVCGHKQGLAVGHRYLPSGECQWGIELGSTYLHDEDFKGPQGNHHWRGVAILHNVKDGNFDPEFISLKSLENRYGIA